MQEIMLDDLFEDEQISESTESQEPTIELNDLEEELEEQTNEADESEELEENEEQEEVEEVEEESRQYDDIEIKFQDDPRTKLSDFTNEEIKNLMQLGEKAEFQIEKHNVKANDMLQRLDRISEMYGTEGTDDLLLQLEDRIFDARSKEEDGKDFGRHPNDIRKEYESNNKTFKERSIERLLSEKPELNSEDIPKEVLEQLKFGKDLVSVYENYLLKADIDNLKSQKETLEKELKTLKQNSKNKKKTFVKGKTSKTSNKSSLLNEIDDIFKI